MSGLRVFLTADGTSLAVERSGTVAVEGRLQGARRGWELVLAASDEPRPEAEVLGALLRELVELAGRFGGGPVHWLRRDPTPLDDDAAGRAGLDRTRDILQLRRPLPVGPADRHDVAAVSTRAFVPGVDDDVWLEVNNRSFADHPDQAGQTQADLRALVSQPWFDADGFRLLDADPTGPRAGRLDGFCWTKVHADHEPPLGEIFVIGVDPSAAGRGLGRALTVAGLDHLHRRGLTIAMLYVDADNSSATALYDRLGFRHHHRDRMYCGDA